MRRGVLVVALVSTIGERFRCSCVGTPTTSQAVQKLGRDSTAFVSLVQTQATWNMPPVDELLQKSRVIFAQTDLELGEAKDRLTKLRMESARRDQAKQAELEKEVFDKRRQVEHARSENDEVAKEIQNYADEIAKLRQKARHEQSLMDKISENLKRVLGNLTVVQEYAEHTLERTGDHGDMDIKGPYKAFLELQAIDAARDALKEKQRKMDMIAAARQDASQDFPNPHVTDPDADLLAQVDNLAGVVIHPGALSVPQADTKAGDVAGATVPEGALSLLQAGAKGIADDIEAMMKKDLANNKRKTAVEEALERQRDELEEYLVNLLQHRAGLEDKEKGLRDRLETLRAAVDFLHGRRKSMEANYHYLLHFVSFVGNDRRTEESLKVHSNDSARVGAEQAH